MTEELRSLASLWGMQTSYHDVSGALRTASADALVAVLAALGAPIARPDDAREALRARRLELWRRAVEPVIVACEGEPFAFEVRLPESAPDRRVAWRLRTEDGGERHGEVVLGVVPAAGAEVEGERYGVFRVGVPERPPLGYHALDVEIGGRTRTVRVLASSRWIGPGDVGSAAWGLFLPLYALATHRGWGAGDLTDLEEFLVWAGGRGARLVGTLPLLASFLDEPYDPSPYAPASRLAWNEFYVDPARAPEWPRCEFARAIHSSGRFQEELSALRRSDHVDYRRLMALKRQVLEALAVEHWSSDSEAFRDRRRFEESRPVVDDYARFRAAVERRRVSWHAWPGAMADGRIPEGEFDEHARRYHVYVQWLCHQQLARLAEARSAGAAELYLDLPLGVHPDGYDVWRERSSFVPGVSVGAPPDPLAPAGQDWGFPPLSPQGLRETGYRYLTQTLRHHLEHSRALRIDHAAGFHRVYWVPRGLGATEGVYVDYPAEELYAVHSIEARRRGALLVGEDLGTIPDSVREGLDRHGIDRMYVLPFELRPHGDPAIPPVPRGRLACLDTHDMPPFASFWAGLDEGSRRSVARALGLGEPLAREALAACLEFLARSESRVVLVNFEDLWLETRPQNEPGTTTERPNWVRRMRRPFEEARETAEVVELLGRVDRLRAERGNGR